MEKESFKSLDKPESFAHAQEIEKEAVLFAKEVDFSFNCPRTDVSKSVQNTNRLRRKLCCLPKVVFFS